MEALENNNQICNVVQEIVACKKWRCDPSKYFEDEMQCKQVLGSASSTKI